jgi:hypothetical protein
MPGTLQTSGLLLIFVQSYKKPWGDSAPHYPSVRNVTIDHTLAQGQPELPTPPLLVLETALVFLLPWVICR